MKNITLVSLTICLISVIVLGIPALSFADIASETNTKAQQHFEKANELLKSMEYEAAIAEYSKVINLSSNSKIAQNAQYWIGQSHFKAGQFDAAQATFAKLIEQYPTSTIALVSKLMVERVEKAKEVEEKTRAMRNAADKGFIIEPKTGVKYTKTQTFVGKRDGIGYTAALISPNGKFLLRGNLVIPLDSGEPFELADMPAGRGTWSPDGGKVAFYSNDGIWLVPVSPDTGHSTGPPKKLLDGKYRYDFNVSWSPDGEKFVFRRRDEGMDVWTISVADGSLTQITNTPDLELAPAWSPDGKSIAYGRIGKKGEHSLWLSSVDGETVRKITDTEHRTIPIWSPDGKWIFLDETFRFIRLAGNKEYALTTPKEVGKFLSWSSDSKKMLFFRSPYDYRVALKVVSASGGPTFELGRQLTLWSYTYFWSPDSRMIITDSEDKEGNNIFWMILLTGGEPLPLELDVTVDKPILHSLSRDCRKLLFSVKQNDGTEDFCVVPISLKDARTTGPAVKVFKGQTKGRAHKFSPDGTKLLIVHEGDIWIASAKGGKPLQITNTPEPEVEPMWSPDGEMIAYKIFYSAGKSVLQVTAASGGKEIMKLEALDAFVWSPDSKELAVAFKNNELSVISVASGKTRRIANLKKMNLTKVYDLRWSPDGENLACVGYHTEKEQSGPIFIIPVEGGKAAEVATDDNGWKGCIYWSPDSKWISYNSDGSVKVRSEGTMWEADFEEILERVSK